MKKKTPKKRNYIYKKISHIRETDFLNIAVIPKELGADGQARYFIQTHSCPRVECDLTILTCSCPSFQMQKPSQGIDPFHEPCKHVDELHMINRWRFELEDAGIL